MFCFACAFATSWGGGGELRQFAGETLLQVLDSCRRDFSVGTFGSDTFCDYISPLVVLGMKWGGGGVRWAGCVGQSGERGKISWNFRE
jgi:hypothetical protein